MKIFLIGIFLIFPSLSKAQVFQSDGCEIILKAKFNKAKIKICNKILDVEVADLDWSRSVGLMCRESLSENSGMIFVFGEEKTLSFWMKNTRIPLSIGYFDKNKILIDTYDMKPLDESKVYPSKKKSMYALETTVGWYEKNKIYPGCKLEFVTKGQ